MIRIYHLIFLADENKFLSKLHTIARLIARITFIASIALIVVFNSLHVIYCIARAIDRARTHAVTALLSAQRAPAPRPLDSTKSRSRSILRLSWTVLRAAFLDSLFLSSLNEAGPV